MKKEEIITAWSGTALLLSNCLLQIKHEDIKTGIICVITAFSIFLYSWSTCKKNNNDNNPDR